MIVGPLTARWTEPVALRLTARRHRPTPPSPEAAHKTLDGQDTVGHK